MSIQGKSVTAFGEASDDELVELARAAGSRDTRPFEALVRARKIFRPGDPLEVRGHRGVLKAITATQTLIEQETGLVTVANTVFLDETIRH